VHVHPRAARKSWLLMAVVTGSLLLGACASGSGDPVRRAEAQVSAKQKELDDATAKAATTTAAFCAAGTDYVAALDRYGDLLTSDATTVGDVRSAGSELAQPRGDAVSAATAAQKAREGVATAQADLANAQAALAAVSATASGTTAPPAAPATATPTPVASVDAVAAVQKADALMTSVVAGVSNDTPLAQASVQFNSAAVALEMAWLRLVVDAGCLTDQQAADGQQAVAAYTTALQQQLTAAGYFTGEVDGIYGPQTEAAVEAVQKAHGLPVTGAVDKATQAALSADLAAKGGAAAQSTLVATAQLQQTLHLAGYWDGPIDGQWTPELTAALQKLQTDLGVEPTGTVDPATVAAFEAAVKALTAPAPAPTPTPEPSATA
jgi:peptidoglycan hydrolase-like protein with peptidoglycan-binding domain